MQDYKTRLIIEMTLKLKEAGTYNLIRILTTIIWLIEFFYVFSWGGTFDIFYFFIAVICITSWYHMGNKHKQAMIEFRELEEEFIKNYEDENL